MMGIVLAWRMVGCEVPDHTGEDCAQQRSDCQVQATTFIGNKK